jgi:hypothetical protein
LAASDSEATITPYIQLLFFADCPNVNAARVALERALLHCGLPNNGYESIDILDPSAPVGLTRWGSPTILVDGDDVSGQRQGDGVGCRVYGTPEQVPTVDMIASAIRAGLSSHR